MSAPTPSRTAGCTEMLTRTERLDRLPFTSAHGRLLVGSGVGWALDAMDVGLISFVMVALGSQWGLSATQQSWIGSIGFVGMAIGASVGGLLADRIGRRQVFALTLLGYGLATGASALAGSVAVLIALRFFVGLGLGAELPVASTLVSEFSPRAIRGRMVVALESFWALGWLFAALIGYLVVPASPDGWRWALAVGVVPTLYAAAVRFGLPESVRFLEKVGYYGAFIWLPNLIFAQGYPMVKSFEYTLIITAAQLPGYALAAYLIERWGRRPTLATFLVGSAVAAILFGHAEGATALLGTGMLLSFFNLGAWGALYAITPEIYPTSIRGTGAGAAAAFGRIASILAPLSVPVLNGWGGIGLVFAVLGTAFAIAAVAAFGLPDHRGLALEE